jgi:hypothetical protein
VVEFSILLILLLLFYNLKERKHPVNSKQSETCNVTLPHRRTIGISAIVSIFIVSLQLFLAGCNVDPVAGLVNNSIGTGILNNAIGKLEQQSSDWQAVLTTTKEDLIKAGQTTLSNEVDKVLRDAIGDAGATAMCGGDYFRSRVKEDLARIRAVYTKKPIVRQPQFCSPNPSEIDMSLVPTRRSSIRIFGYNFDVAAQNLQILLVDNNGNQTNVTKNSSGVSNIAYPTNYELTVNLSNNGVVLNNTGKQLIFKLSDTQIQSVNILQPVIPIGVSVNVFVQQPTQWQGWNENPNGDYDYSGTTGQGLQLEAIRMNLLNAPSSMHIHYAVQLQGCGWGCNNSQIPTESMDGGVAGTTNQNRRLEAVKIWLTGAPAGVHVQYRSYIQNYGWEKTWQSDGAISGTVGAGARLEAINVKIVMP